MSTELTLRREAALFRDALERERVYARACAAAQLACGVDLAEALDAAPNGRGLAVLRLARALERERLRGSRRHWSYDLNRHIALAQALKRLRSADR